MCRKNHLTKRVIVLTVEFEVIRSYSRLVLTQNFALFDPIIISRRTDVAVDADAPLNPHTSTRSRAQLMLRSQSGGFSWLVCWINILRMKCPFFRHSERWNIFRIRTKSTRGRRTLWRRHIRTAQVQHHSAEVLTTDVFAQFRQSTLRRCQALGCRKMRVLVVPPGGPYWLLCLKSRGSKVQSSLSWRLGRGEGGEKGGVVPL